MQLDDMSLEMQKNNAHDSQPSYIPKFVVTWGVLIDATSRRRGTKCRMNFQQKNQVVVVHFKVVGKVKQSRQSGGKKAKGHAQGITRNTRKIIRT